MNGMAGGRWAAEQQQNIQQNMRASEEPNIQAAWATEFGGSSRQSGPPALQQNMAGRPECAFYNNISSTRSNPRMADQQRPLYMAQSGSYGSSMPMNMYGMNSGFNPYQSMNSSVVETKGKGKEVDYEAAFAQIAASLLPGQTSTSGIVEVVDGVSEIENTLKGTTLDSSEEELGTEFRQSVLHQTSLMDSHISLQSLGPAPEFRPSTTQRRPF